MPAWIIRLLQLLRRIPWHKIPWDLIWRSARWLFEKGRGLLRKNLTAKERRELEALMRKAKGRRKNLSEKERRRFVELVRKAFTGAAAT